MVFVRVHKDISCFSSPHLCTKQILILCLVLHKVCLQLQFDQVGVNQIYTLVSWTCVNPVGAIPPPTGQMLLLQSSSLVWF